MFISCIHKLILLIISSCSHFFTAGQDYTGVSGFFTFSTLQTILCAIISINDDSVVEGQECFNFNLAAPAGVNNPQPTTPVCIVDNDAPPQQQCELVYYTDDV